MGSVAKRCSPVYLRESFPDQTHEISGNIPFSPLGSSGKWETPTYCRWKKPKKPYASPNINKPYDKWEILHMDRLVASFPSTVCLVTNRHISPTWSLKIRQNKSPLWLKSDWCSAMIWLVGLGRNMSKRTNLPGTRLQKISFNEHLILASLEPCHFPGQRGTWASRPRRQSHRLRDSPMAGCPLDIPHLKQGGFEKPLKGQGWKGLDGDYLG